MMTFSARIALPASAAERSARPSPASRCRAPRRRRRCARAASIAARPFAAEAHDLDLRIGSPASRVSNPRMTAESSTIITRKGSAGRRVPAGFRLQRCAWLYRAFPCVQRCSTRAAHPGRTLTLDDLVVEGLHDVFVGACAASPPGCAAMSFSVVQNTTFGGLPARHLRAASTRKSKPFMTGMFQSSRMASGISLAGTSMAPPGRHRPPRSRSCRPSRILRATMRIDARNRRPPRHDFMRRSPSADREPGPSRHPGRPQRPQSTVTLRSRRRPPVRRNSSS